VEALAILFGALFTVASAWSLGRLLVRREDMAPVVFLCGAAALSGVVFAVSAVRLAYPATFLAIGIAAIAAARPRLRRCGRPILLLLPFAVYFVLYLCNAMAPEVSADGTAYHLSLVARYLRDHGFVRLTTNMYASLSQGLEMLFLFAFAFGRHSAAAVVHFAFLVALAWTMWLYGRRSGFPLAGACAALLAFASPGMGVDATSAYNDVALASTAFGLFFLLQAWDEERGAALLPAIGLLAGFAYAIKYTGGVAVLYALGFIAWKSWRKRDPRTLRHLAIAAACASVLILPWMVKNWIWAGNPLAPFFNQFFPNPYVTVAFEIEYKEILTRYGLATLWQLPMQVTTYGLLSGLLGPVFLLSPVALLALRRREGRQLLLAAAVFGALYFSNVGARFLIPVLPFVGMAMMLAVADVRGLGLAIALLHAVVSWPAIVPRYAQPGAWYLHRVPWKHALRLRPAEDYLRSNLIRYPIDRMIESATPPGSTVFTFTPIPESYTSRNIVVAYQSAEGKMAEGLLWTLFVPEYAPNWRLRFAFPSQPLRALRVVQTGAGTRDLWNIHEFRIYDGLRELPRSPRWRLTAKPYPWGIQDAFDNSLLTFWKCGEWIRPGQFVSVDFAAAETADAVVLETAPNQLGIKLQLEGETAGGEWKTLAASPKVGDAPRPFGLARAVMEELKRRGIDSILVFDADLGASEIHRSAESWGLRETGRAQDARLYRLP
jgi:hypothetical protein